MVYTRDFSGKYAENVTVILSFLSSILTHNPPLFWYNVDEVIQMAVNNIIKSDNMELLEQLQNENQLLLEENKKLNDTVGWMHDTIWRLVRKQQTEG